MRQCDGAEPTPSPRLPVVIKTIVAAATIGCAILAAPICRLWIGEPTEYGLPWTLALLAVLGLCSNFSLRRPGMAAYFLTVLFAIGCWAWIMEFIRGRMLVGDELGFLYRNTSNTTVLSNVFDFLGISSGRLPLFLAGVAVLGLLSRLLLRSIPAYCRSAIDASLTVSAACAGRSGKSGVRAWGTSIAVGALLFLSWDYLDPISRMSIAFPSEPIDIYPLRWVFTQPGLWLGFPVAATIIGWRHLEVLHVDQDGVRLSFARPDWTVFRVAWVRVRRIDFISHQRTAGTAVLRFGFRRFAPLSLGLHGQRYHDPRQLLKRIEDEAVRRGIDLRWSYSSDKLRWIVPCSFFLDSYFAVRRSICRLPCYGP